MPSTRPILVTGATGTVGRPLAARLLADGHRVRALVRDPDTAGLPDGVEAVRGDLSAPETVAAAADGASAAFLVWPFAVADGADKLVAALAAHVDRVVYLSSAVADTHPGRPDGTVERLVEQAVPHWTFLRPHGFMANALRWLPELRATGEVHGAYGQAATAPIHEADLADVAALALTGLGHDGARHVLTGPAALTQTAQLAALAEAVDRELAWHELTRAEARARMLATGWPPQVVDPVLDHQAARVTDPERPLPTLERITGRPARTFATWAADHAAELRAALGVVAEARP
ncbi:NAD(P)H-binding protein [Yinghuangia seranimata]|uniref:NAD(P)H-binding protein n=1 Tax=Yinghuangia seranimata TaxID=408067 RepID=UPI00248C4ECA|nr:NAD(P)H-binding protein [Yinghuangia seranimata]MDI2125748.1 NAD(P)H-binding protein [Yinghuangia seranimata]